MIDIARDYLRFLTFRPTGPGVRSRFAAYLSVGLTCTWLAGVGRYWDNSRADWWQYAGLGSLIYVFVLAAVIWLLVLPLRPEHWSYRNVLLFVVMTAPPALLYAIPVERFMSFEASQATNAWFLGIVATWRVALYVTFLRRIAKLRIGKLIVAALLPLVLIVAVLAVLNLEHVVFQLMGGIEESEQSANDSAYFVVLTLSWFSLLSSPVLLIWYVVAIVEAWSTRERGESTPAAEGAD